MIEAAACETGQAATKSASRATGMPAKREMRARLILVSHRFEANDGQGRVNYEVALRALDLGYPVTILATHCAEEISAHTRANHVTVGNSRLPTALLRDQVLAAESARWLRRNRTPDDLVLGNGFITWKPCDVNAAHFVHHGWLRDPSYAFRGWKLYSVYQRIYTLLNVRWEKRAFLAASRTIAVSELIAAQLRALGVPSDRITTVPNGVDTEQFSPGPPERSSFGLPEGRPLALFAGDIRTPRKGLDTVLQALAEVPQLSLAVAGAQEGSPYPALARRLGIADRVYFLGQVKRMAELMRSVDMFTFPSRYEPFGLVILEAMSCGIPVIVSASSGAADFIAGGGFTLPDSNDAKALADAMAQLCSQPSLRHAMGAAGRKQALGMSWGKMADGYMRVFEELLQQKAKTGGRKALGHA